MLMRKPLSVLRAVIPAITAVVALSADASERGVEVAVDLGEYQWKNRVLLIFAPARGEPLFQTLHDSLMVRGADLADRDLVIFEVFESGPSTEGGEPLDPETARLLRKKFQVPNGAFSVILVGKDGGVKLDRQERSSLEQIFALIDSMPMRQHEMRRENP